MSEGADNSTVQADLRPLVPSLPFLELRIGGSHGSRHLPFLSNPLAFRLESGAEWSVELGGDFRLLFLCRSQERPPLEAMLGQTVEVGDERLRVVDLRTLPPYHLVSLSAELAYRTWPMSDGIWTVGRPGRRQNDVALTAASISRAHARFEIRDKVARLVAEASGALSAVNGQTLEAEQTHDLQPNDVIQLGELLFRWEREERAFTHLDGKLRLKALGANSVSLGTARQDELEFRNENARNLLFWMCACRDSELPVERILDGYWPERPVLRQRKNLSHTLKALQNELGWSDAVFAHMIPRNADTVRLEKAAVESCDIWELQDAVRQFPRHRLSLAAVLELHPGPLLPHQQQGWVRALRVELFTAWLGLLERCGAQPEAVPRLAETLTRCLRDGDFEEFAYERVFRLAVHYGLERHIAPWLADLKERLLASTGELPSPELSQLAARLSRL